MQSKIVNEPNLVRDDNNVIRNINDSDFRAYLNKRNAVLEQRRRIDNLEKDNKEIKESLALILQLLQNKDKT